MLTNEPAMRLEDMSKDDLLDLCKILIQENAQLKLSHGHLAENYNKLLREQQQAMENLKELKDLREAVKKLADENDRLRNENSALETRLSDVEGRLKAVEERDHPITVREAMRILERHICKDVVESNKQFKFFYNFDKLSRATDTAVQAKFSATLEARGLTQDHVAMLGYLKDCGDESAHHLRPSLSKDDLVATAQGDIGDPNADLITGLFDALAHYIPLPTNPK